MRLKRAIRIVKILQFWDFWHTVQFRWYQFTMKVQFLSTKFNLMKSGVSTMEYFRRIWLQRSSSVIKCWGDPNTNEQISKTEFKQWYCNNPLFSGCASSFDLKGIWTHSWMQPISANRMYSKIWTGRPRQKVLAHSSIWIFIACTEVSVCVIQHSKDLVIRIPYGDFLRVTRQTAYGIHCRIGYKFRFRCTSCAYFIWTVVVRPIRSWSSGVRVPGSCPPTAD